MAKDYEKFFVKPSITDARKRKTSETSVIDFNEYFNVNFSNEEFSTIGGLIIHAFGHLPKRDEKITFEGFKITILRADSRKLYSVLLEIDSPSNSV
jgi:magnesium and cobalt transporter